MATGPRRGARDGGALIMIAGDPEPELLADLDQERVGKARPVDALMRQLQRSERADGQLDDRRLSDRGAGGSRSSASPTSSGSGRRSPHAVRLDEADPVAAWRAHVDKLRARCRSSTRPRFDAVHFSGRAPT